MIKDKNTKIYPQKTKVRVHIRQYAQDWIDRAVNIMNHSEHNKTTDEITTNTTHEKQPQTENPSTNIGMNKSPFDGNKSAQLYGKGTIITHIQDQSVPVPPNQVIQALQILRNGMKQKYALQHNETINRCRMTSIFNGHRHPSIPIVFACAVPNKAYEGVHGTNYKQNNSKTRYSPYSTPSKASTPEFGDSDPELEELSFNDKVSLHDSEPVLTLSHQSHHKQAHYKVHQHEHEHNPCYDATYETDLGHLHSMDHDDGYGQNHSHFGVHGHSGHNTIGYSGSGYNHNNRIKHNTETVPII